MINYIIIVYMTTTNLLSEPLVSHRDLFDCHWMCFNFVGSSMTVNKSISLVIFSADSWKQW